MPTKAHTTSTTASGFTSNLFLFLALVSTYLQTCGSASVNTSSVISGCQSQSTTSPSSGTPGYEGNPSEPANRTNRCNTQFGVGYEVWWKTIVNWTSPEATPVLGEYSSLNATVITQHAKWLSNAGIDFVLVDLSNSDSEIALSAVDKLVNVYLTLDTKPKIAILLGTATAGTLQSKADLIKHRYFSNSSNRDLFLQYKGKPLLQIYSGAIFHAEPNYTNPDFTIRFLGAFQEITLNAGGIWAWTNRKPIIDGPLTNISTFDQTGLTGWTEDPAWHITGGMYASTEPNGTATQQTGNITSPTFTITADAIQFNAIGTDPIAQAGLASIGSRNIYLLKDATTGTILRSESPPGSITTFFLRQWNVRDLKGRDVVFQAVSNAGASAPSTLGWLGFYGLAQLESEFMTVNAQLGGNEFFGMSNDWDAHSRYFGATLVYNMIGAYNYEPDIVLVQQWNEFQSPDQFGVEGSNDMEPTVVNKLAGVNSDGWGYYYLNLTTELIQQYRMGNEFPAVMLDTRYP